MTVLVDIGNVTLVLMEKLSQSNKKVLQYCLKIVRLCCLLDCYKMSTEYYNTNYYQKFSAQNNVRG